jgi:hypothetical protein
LQTSERKFRRETDEGSALETDWQEFTVPAALPSNTGLSADSDVPLPAHFTHNDSLRERSDVTYISTGRRAFLSFWLIIDSGDSGLLEEAETGTVRMSRQKYSGCMAVWLLKICPYKVRL